MLSTVLTSTSLLLGPPTMDLPGKMNISMNPSQLAYDPDFIPPSLDHTTGVISKDVVIDPDNGVSARLFIPNSALLNNSNNSKTKKKKLPVLVFYHGGAFMLLSPFGFLYHNYLNSLVSQANVLAVAVDYRKAPKHLLPAAYDDGFAAVKWAASHANGGGPDEWLAAHGDFNRFFIGGDSSGENICHQVALRIGTDGLGFGIDHKIEGMVCIHPYFWGSKPLKSEVRDPYYKWLWRTVNSPEVGSNLDHPWLNPLADGAPSLKGIWCKRALVCITDKDVLVLRGKAYYEALKESGWDGEVELFETKGMPHGFYIDLVYRHSEQAKELMNKVVAFLNTEEEKEDGFFEGLYVWLLGDHLAKVEPAEVADQTFKEPTLVQWIAARSCLFSCIEPLLKHGFLGYKRLFQ